LKTTALSDVVGLETTVKTKIMRLVILVAFGWMRDHTKKVTTSPQGIQQCIKKKQQGMHFSMK